MDPIEAISLASSGIQIVDLGIRVTRGLLDYNAVIQDEKSNAALTTEKLARLANSLNSLNLQCKQIVSGGGYLIVSESLKSCLVNCEKLFRDLQEELSVFNQAHHRSTTAKESRATDEPVVYPFRLNTTQKLNRTIDDVIADVTSLASLLPHRDSPEEQDKYDQGRTEATDDLEKALGTEHERRDRDREDRGRRRSGKPKDRDRFEAKERLMKRFDERPAVAPRRTRFIEPWGPGGQSPRYEAPASDFDAYGHMATGRKAPSVVSSGAYSDVPSTASTIGGSDSSAYDDKRYQDGPYHASPFPRNEHVQVPYRSGSRRDSNGFHSHDSQSSDDNDSIFSIADLIARSRASTLASASISGTEAIDTILVRGLTDLFRRDEVLMSVISVAVSQENIGFERMRSNFRRLVKHCARELKVETFNNHHQKLAGFVSSHADRIARELFSTQSLRDHQAVEDRGKRMEEYLSELDNTREREQDPTPDSDEESDTGSTDDVVDEESYHHLHSMEAFILESAAYETLHRRLNEFVYPSFQSKLGDLASSWSRPDHKHHAYVTRYNILNLVAELRYIDPSNIQIHDVDEAGKLWSAILGSCQNSVEKQSGVRWDWWPLPRCPRYMEVSESRVRWKCTCGEDRWAEVPSPFAKRLRSMINNFPVTTGHGSNPTPLPDTQGSNESGVGQGSRVPHPHPGGGQGNQQSAGSPAGNASQPGSSRLRVGVTDTTVTNYRVLLLVKRGADYKLAQIYAKGLNSRVFFSKLREEYFHLRGFLRGWFSVWRYSHCDFYMCEKFDDHEFSPRKKDNFPNVTNTDYDYRPKPMDSIPPISEHEFEKRFYACHQPQPILHWYHKCGKLGAHSHDLLKLLPKKKTELEEGGDKREQFWGIYAREMVSFGWVLFYNIVCILPMLVFFIAWTLPSGRSTDLQNPFMPFSMMVTMLSLFWSLFLSSLQFGRSH